MAESKISRIGAFLFPLSAEKLRKRWKSIVKVYTLTYFKILLIRNKKLISKNRRREVECMDESKIYLNWNVSFYIVGREIKEKAPFKPPATSPLTISCVSSIECQILTFT